MQTRVIALTPIAALSYRYVIFRWCLTQSLIIKKQFYFQFCARVAEPYINPGCKSGIEIDIINVLQDKLEFKV